MLTIFVVVILLLNLAILALLFSRKAGDNSALIKESNERIGRALREEMGANREEIARSIKNFGDSVDKRIFTLAEMQNKNFGAFSDKLGEVIEKNDKKMEYVRETIEKRLENIQKDNSEKLEKMRETVDEKLHATLEKRLGESFKLVSERLELVHKGLGEMQTLASGVGDLKKVLQNVKTRGTWGEVQLGTLLDQIMTIEQYEKNVATKKDSNDRVEFAIKIPAKDEKLKNIWLPIDAKFPLEDFQNLIDAEEKCDIALIASLGKALEVRIKSEAKDIREKYLDPPYTTDFGILFLPIEGLYAEVLRRPGLADTLQREYKVIVTGPTTIAAILNSLQMGFRTLAIEKRSSDVWITLGAIKKDFASFGDLLDKTHKKLQEASNTIEDASKKSRTIERKLGKVQELPVPEIVKELPLGIEVEE
ncbi:MAG: DNA recombination protein RmuC [Candidatus Moranbacteria bacterium]|nr:DNA recombination protein RmuC [Candidatus Moranbacteria bacterium]